MNNIRTDLTLGMAAPAIFILLWLLFLTLRRTKKERALATRLLALRPGDFRQEAAVLRDAARRVVQEGRVGELQEEMHVLHLTWPDVEAVIAHPYAEGFPARPAGLAD